ncbi:hypothetical protein T440DRAFT_473063 [Plenodomus tracheiphilus IPT5]|uniref:Uncharacterized protein n=1 Tax=Plenodomus tracheiphilus IPT5 TaxID=1408161 RepID=A0A6A7ANQ9_9PLEO|nr:hypothetical protein T440DRAFT_473063 [Plenodomus tracheiphilus IPT5]
MPDPIVDDLKAKLADAEQELATLRQHHAECDIVLHTKKRHHAECDIVLPTKKRHLTRSRIQALINDINCTYEQQAPKGVNMHGCCTNANVAMEHLKQKATSLILMRTNPMNLTYCRIELFCYLSGVAAGHALGSLTLDETDELVKLVFTNVDRYEYAQRIRKGVKWIHRHIIGRLVRSGWRLELATAIVARYAPTTASTFRHIKDDDADQVDELISKFEAVKASPHVNSLPLWSVPNNTANSDPTKSFNSVCEALGYLTAKEGILFSLLHVCTLVGHPIHKSLLKAAGKFRNRWSTDGNIEQFNILELGLDPAIYDVLSDHSDLDRTLVHYESLGLVETRDSGGSGETLIVSRVKATNHDPDLKQAIRLSCFFFTGCCEYFSTMRQHSLRALPLLRKLVFRHTQDSSLRPTGIMLRALLQASKFSDNEWKSQSIAFATDAVPDGIDANDRAYLAYRRSFVLRAKGDLKQAKRVIVDYWRAISPSAPVDPLLHSIHGLLTTSRSWIHIAEMEFEEAIMVCTHWTATNTSLYQMRVERKLATVRGIANKHIGRYQIAINNLRLGLADDTFRTRSYVLANLCDAYCENKTPLLAYDILTQEKKGILSVVTILEALKDTYHRTLLLSFSEVCCVLEKHQESDEILWQLKHYYERDGVCIARNDQQRHIRTLLLLAQSSHRRAQDIMGWSSALQLWESLVHWVSKYEVLSTSGWDYAAICLSLHCANQNIPGKETDVDWLRKASVIFLSPKADHFWMRSMPTFWLSYILQQDSNICPSLHASIVSHARLGGVGSFRSK